MASSAPEASQDLRRVGEIVLAAAALDPGEREAFLRQVTLSRRDLLAEVRRRLELAAALPESFLAVPAAELLAVADQVASGDGEPSSDGPRYEPEECVGEGGMARVHKAFDRQLQRRVALKFLDRIEPDARRRFLREAQAQARVRHGNVLEVYETGELDGRPFIAMRWVDGPTLLAIRGETSLEQKVRLIAQVAEGLHEAHREGLTHRDVKPSNILVERTPDGDWKPWIADFGIASWSGGASGERLAGTPAYLAPELLRGGAAQADRRADVYGLGVTLYEFLTGERPFRSLELTELLHQVSEEAPRSPREILPGLPADLAAIVLKCLEKDPEARYPSARALAEDLRRFLNGEAVEAHTATLTYRLARFAVRHRRLLAVAGIAAVLLMATLTVAAVLGVAERAANRRAELRRGQAEDLIGFMLTDLRGKLDPLGKLEILDDVGKRAMQYFAAVPEEELSDDELARRSQALYQIGDVRIKQGDLTGALKPLQESLALARALADRDPAADRLFGLGQSRFWVGYVHLEQGDLAATRPHFEAYRDLSERLVRMEPQSVDYQLELAYAHSNLGTLEKQAGSLEAALVSFRKTLELNRALVARDAANQDWRFELAATHDLVGHTLLELGRLDEALPHFEANLAQRQALVRQDPENLKFRDFLGTAHDSLAVWQEDRGHIAESLAQVRASREIFADLVAHDPENQLWRWELELSRMKAGRLLVLQGDTRKGLALLAETAGTAAHRVEREPTDRKWRLLAAWSHIHLATALEKLERDGEARSAVARAVAWLGSLRDRGPEDRDASRWLAKALLVQGGIDSRRGEDREARAAWERARHILAPFARGSNDVEILDPWASVLLVLDRRDEARPVLAALAASGYRHPELLALCRARDVEIPERRQPAG
jgi:eukaryotic-like serine/threonine-protein kinase